MAAESTASVQQELKDLQETVKGLAEKVVSLEQRVSELEAENQAEETWSIPSTRLHIADNVQPDGIGLPPGIAHQLGGAQQPGFVQHVAPQQDWGQRAADFVFLTNEFVWHTPQTTPYNPVTCLACNGQKLCYLDVDDSHINSKTHQQNMNQALRRGPWWRW